MIKLEYRNASFGFVKRANYVLAIELTKAATLADLKAAVYSRIKDLGVDGLEEYRREGASSVRSFVDLEFFEPSMGAPSRQFWELETPYNRDIYNLLRVARFRWEQLIDENRNKIRRASTSWSAMAAALELHEMNSEDPLATIANGVATDLRLEAVDGAPEIIRQAMRIIKRKK